jgi:hypothetical protein
LSGNESSSKRPSDDEIFILQAELEKEKQKNKDIQKYTKSLEAKFELCKKMLYQKDILITQLEKLSGVGQYVPEIIHKLKNPLMGISGYTELAEIAETREDMLLQLDKIHPQINRLSTLLGQFRSMVSYSSNEFVKVDLSVNLTEALQVMELFKPKIFEIQSDFPKTDIYATCDPDQLLQVHFNLAKIIFKNIPHDQNRIIGIDLRKITKEECLNMTGDAYIHSLSSNRWIKLMNKFNEFSLIRYQSDLLDISGDKIRDILSEDYNSDTVEPASLLVSFKIILDIVRRHSGNFILHSQDSNTFFNIILPVS